MKRRKNTIRSNALLAFYRFWHGRLHLKGAGVLLRLWACVFPELGCYKLDIPHIGCLTVNLKDDSGMAWLNYSLGESGHEDGMIAAIKRLAPKNPILWDIGANAGFFAATLAGKIRDYSEIRLFEPNPQLIPCLSELSASLPNIRLHNLAFSDTSGTLTLHIPEENSTLASLKPVANSLAVHVECMTGDRFLSESGVPAPDVIIIDTEGNDCHVIRGLRELIAWKRPVIFFEHIFVTEEEILSVTPTGYTHFTVDDHSGEFLPGVLLERGHNSVFIPC